MGEITKKLRFLFDMDGVLAEYKEAKNSDEYRTAEFFLNLAADEKMIEVLKLLIKWGCRVAILTACYFEDSTAKEGKMEWMKKLGLENVEMIFVPVGEKKYNYVNQNDINVLIDDYSWNLHTWKQEGGLAFKYMNGVNGTKGTWSGYRVDNKMSPEEIATALVAIAAAEAAKREG